MSEETIKKVIEKVEKMTEANESFEDNALQNFAITIDYLLRERTRKEEVLASASAMLALAEYRKGLEKHIEYAKIGGLKEREATLLEILEQIDKWYVFFHPRRCMLTRLFVLPVIASCYN